MVPFGVRLRAGDSIRRRRLLVDTDARRHASSPSLVGHRPTRGDGETLRHREGTQQGDSGDPTEGPTRGPDAGTANMGEEPPHHLRRFG